MSRRRFPLMFISLLAGVMVLCATVPMTPWLSPAGAFGDEPNDKVKGEKSSKKGPGKEGVRKKRKKGKKKADMSEVPADEKAETEALRQVGEAFKLKRTRHYSIVFDTSKKDVKTFGVAIEKTYRSCVNYCLKLGFDAKQPKKKLLIYYFEEHGAYSNTSQSLGKGQLSQNMPGVYFPDLNFSMFYNYRNQDSFKRAREEAEQSIARLREQLRRGNVSRQQRKNIQRQIAAARRQANRSDLIGGDASESTVQHEVSHQVLWNIGFHNAKAFLANPRWFAEGTAMMFEPISDGRSANFGAVNQQRLRGYRALLRGGRLIPVRELVSDFRCFGPRTIEVAYPESWALVHYLNRTKRKQIKKYVVAINKRPEDFIPMPEAELATFEEAFGKLDEKWVRRWHKWMENVR